MRLKPRWAILALLFGSTVLNYVDRQTLSILATTIQKDLAIDDAGYARVVQYFLIAYTLAYFGVGWVTDRLGSKRALALFVGWWSLANMVTGLVHSAGQLGAARFALGLGEAGNYVAAPKAVSEHYAPHERGFAVGVYTAGAMVGATIAPPLIGWLALAYGWRAAFMVTGALGFLWMTAWLALRQGQPRMLDAGAVAETTTLRAILADKSVWGLALARTITDPAWYFYLFWFPKYLGDARGLPLAGIAATAWLVYLAADIGSIGGGLLSGRLVQRGAAPIAARLKVMAVGAGLAPFGALIALQPPLPATYALAALVALSHMMFLGNLTTLAVDRFPQARIATIFGLIAAGSGIGGIVSTQLVGAFAATRDYGTVYLARASLQPSGWVMARLTGGRVRENDDAA